MDFFAQQAKVRRSSRTLVLLFVLAVLAIVVAVDLICAFVLGVRRGLRVLTPEPVRRCLLQRVCVPGSGLPIRAAGTEKHIWPIASVRVQSAFSS